MQKLSPSFYWHDYETWGLIPALDRPAQFSGIRTDINFNIISEPDMFYCRLSDDYLPNPDSVLITHISPRVTQSKGLAEFEFAAKIHQQFSQANTCVVGYNNIRFDDEFSRYIFYRNFYDPYEYSWKNGNSRWDIIDLVRATYALRPQGIEWPKDENGLPSFRLELLTAANGISHKHAHDATADVYATIAIIKLIKANQPKLLNYYFNLKNKRQVKALIDATHLQPLVHVSNMFGAVRSNIALVTPIVWHPNNENAVVVVDLAKDISPLLDLSADEIRERLYTKKEQLDGKLAIPLKLIHTNKCPFVALETTLSAEDAERVHIDRQTCLQNLGRLKNNPQIMEVIKTVFQSTKPLDNKDNVDAALYDGFFADKDKLIFAKIRNSSSAQLATAKFTATDKRFTELFFRYRGRNFPQSLSDDEHKKWTKYQQTTMTDKAADYLATLVAYKNKYQADKPTYNALSDLYDYAQKIISQCSA